MQEEVEHATELWDARVLSLLGDADVGALDAEQVHAPRLAM